MDFKIIKKDNTKKREWAGGVSTELYIFPENSSVNSDFTFRISISTIKPGVYPFSDFHGYKRFLALLSGEIDLDINSQTYNITESSFISFSGEDKVISKTEKNCIDFNFIYKENLQLIESKFITKPFLAVKSNYIYIYYNLEKEKSIKVNHRKYSLKKEELLICCGNNFSIDDSGVGILLSIKL